MKLFELFLAPGRAGTPILSDEILEATGARVFSPEEAEIVGLEGIPADPEGHERMFIACRPADERLIATRLDHSAAVARYRLHELGEAR
jgi:hypothetical protein